MAVLLKDSHAVVQMLVQSDPLGACTSRDPEGLTAVQLCAERGKHQNLTTLLKLYDQAHARWITHLLSLLAHCAYSQSAAEPQFPPTRQLVSHPVQLHECTMYSVG